MRILLSFLLLVALSGAAGAGEVCIVPTAANGTNGTVDCDALSPTLWSNTVAGYRTDGFASCFDNCFFGPGQYGWYISNSTADPGQITGALTPPLDELYLWLN